MTPEQERRLQQVEQWIEQLGFWLWIWIASAIVGFTSGSCFALIDILRKH